MGKSSKYQGFINAAGAQAAEWLERPHRKWSVSGSNASRLLHSKDLKIGMVYFSCVVASDPRHTENIIRTDPPDVSILCVDESLKTYYSFWIKCGENLQKCWKITEWIVINRHWVGLRCWIVTSTHRSPKQSIAPLSPTGEDSWHFMWITWEISADSRNINKYAII